MDDDAEAGKPGRDEAEDAVRKPAKAGHSPAEPWPERRAFAW
jgi:hypothetical protein